MISVALFHHIRQLFEREGLSQRQIAKKLGISRNTVAKYLKQDAVLPTAVERKQIYSNQQYSEETQRVIPIIEQWLQEDQHVWKKQKHTAARIHRRLQDEYDFTGSASNLRKVVAKLKKNVQEVFIPLEFQSGQQAQVDWGHADISLNGVKKRIHLFCFELSASRVMFVRAYLDEKQESFLDGFVHAFSFVGGVPAEALCDNLKTAVIKILTGRDRLEQESFQALQAHYVFKGEFCNVRSGNEKGRVESLVGNVRRNALVPIPEVRTLEELNQHLLHWCEQTTKLKQVPHSQELVYDAWQRERKKLRPLPLVPFEACKIRDCEVSKISTVTFETNQYSVPCSYVGRSVWLKAFVDRVIIVAQNQVIAEHVRSNDRYQLVLELDHYLEALLRKPRALHHAQVMNSSKVPEIIRRFHQSMHAKSGAEGDRAFIRFLLYSRQIGMASFTKILEQAEILGIFYFEGLYDLLNRSTGQFPEPAINVKQVPIDLNAYRVKKSDLKQYSALLGGDQG